jgi:hypothetical protein
MEEAISTRFVILYYACRELSTLKSVGYLISTAMSTASAAFTRSTGIICDTAMEKAISIVQFFDIFCFLRELKDVIFVSL